MILGKHVVTVSLQVFSSNVFFTVYDEKELSGKDK
jgi:hypothetical protein